MSRFTVYQADQVVITAPIPITDGLAVENFLKITFPDRYGDDRGADGLVTRYTINDRRADVELTLKGASLHNLELSALHIADVLAGNGAGIGPLSFNDPNGTTVFLAARSWIAKVPDLSFGEQRPDCVWKFRCMYDPVKCLIGGNNEPS